MIQLKWGSLRDQSFADAIDRVIRQPMGFELGQKFVLVGRELKKQKELLQECHDKLLKEFGSPDPKDKRNYIIPENNVQKFETEFKKMISHTFEIRVNKFDAKKLSEKIDLSPEQWLALEAFFTPTPTVTPLEVAGTTNIGHQNGKETPQNNATDT